MSFTIKKTGTGTVHTSTTQKGVEKPIDETHETHVVPYEVRAGDGVPLVNVNASLGARIGLPDFSDYRVSVSLTLPANLDVTSHGNLTLGDEVEAAFAAAYAWCEEKMREKTGKKLVDA